MKLVEQEYPAMFGDGALSFREWAVGEPLPLAIVHDAILEFLRGRDDAVLFGAQAVNAYTEPSRMTADVNILTVRAAELAEEVRFSLHRRFQLVVQVASAHQGTGYRVFQIRQPKNRQLVQVGQVETLPPRQWVQDILVVTPAELIAGKVRAFQGRRGQPRSGTDRRDIALLLLTFPDLKTDAAPVRDRLVAAGANAAELTTWAEIAAVEIRPENEDDEFNPA